MSPAGYIGNNLLQVHDSNIVQLFVSIKQVRLRKSGGIRRQLPSSLFSLFRYESGVFLACKRNSRRHEVKRKMKGAYRQQQ
mmetsp:Transcript_4152/g.7298  ORF Transcript_4152/g.7298 Transcript_4152/m.7298 type:complete len:81 (-) Transcript_4152:120-362(-)